MSRQAQTGRLLLSPPFSNSGAASLAFRGYAEKLARTSPDSEGVADVLDYAFYGSLARTQRTPEHPTALRAALCVLSDLARQGWFIRVTGEGTVEVERPDDHHDDPARAKDRIRDQELVKRDEQLREVTTRKFVIGMESATVYRGQPVSVFSLFRDGRDLARSLRKARSRLPENGAEGLREAIDPYLEFVDDATVCEHSGLRLRDVWRYFRHTWTNHYTPRPGRSVALLVRDRARAFHPIIGIAAIGSPVVQIRERDEWIGWHPETFLERVSRNPPPELGKWLNSIVDRAVREIFVDDFVEEQRIRRCDLSNPSSEAIDRLRIYGEEQRVLHHRLAHRKELKQSAKPDDEGKEHYWQTRARTHLYRSKRALTLSEMLRARQCLREYLGDHPAPGAVRALIESKVGRRIVKRVLRKAKADRVGIAVADITVCGAVAPYNQILGGKLVSMLMASPEVLVRYRDKYLEQESEIASAMAGRPIVRPSRLVFLETTSLYGSGSSQYNRLRMPAERLGGRPGESIEYLKLGKSEAYGTSHFSAETVEALVALVQQTSNGQRVNNIFGEGVSPKLRKMRDGLDALGFPTDELLQHGRRRIVYGVPLVRNLREFLVGMDQEPDYLLDMTTPKQGTTALVRWWSERWLSRRIMNDEVLARLEEHTLVRPIRHGARVALPTVDDGREHPDLFDDLPR